MLGVPEAWKGWSGAGAWLLGPVATPTSVLGVVLELHGLGPGSVWFPGSPGPLPVWGPEMASQQGQLVQVRALVLS